MPYADYSLQLAANRARAKTPGGKAARARATQAYRQRHKDRIAAHNAVSKAVLRGKLIPWPVCAVPECNREKPEAHHPDYSDGARLAVVWLCGECHKAAHNLTKLLKGLQ
jgi:hypothetical protein